ncbi:MAG: tetratricopeptide (TPR) repeat protein [Planctomycetota bacterium]|jgi:tetratricopeptide (TPR) repeat protein
MASQEAGNEHDDGQAALRPPVIPLRARLPALIPLGVIWVIALLPVGFYLLHQSNPQAAVSLSTSATELTLHALLVAAAAAIVGFFLYPPLPAWVRRFFDRTRTKWSADRAPMARAISELKHFETAQKHFEVAKLAWIRSDYALVATHAQRSVALDGTLPSAQHLLGLISLQTDALPEALAAFSAAEQLDPGHAFGQALLHKARVQHLLGDQNAALASFEQYARAHGSNHRSNYWHGETLFAANRSDEAAKAFHAAAADPKARLTAEENWFRARARVRCWRIGRVEQTAGDSK